jgi:hypothetical protein
MDVVYRCCCGMDVHKKIIAANLLRKGVEGREDIDEVRRFGTTTKELLALSDWLKAAVAASHPLECFVRHCLSLMLSDQLAHLRDKRIGDFHKRL